MTNYWDNNFCKHLGNVENIKYICEVGARYGDESIKLSTIFTNATILSFECNPNTINICKINLEKHKNITFYDIGLGSEEAILPFYSYVKNNDGASSFLQRIDFDNTQKLSGNITIKPLSSVLHSENIPYVDILCMDVQGFELNVLKGCNNYISKIKYVIMEEPKEIINPAYLPQNVHSKYINAPSSCEIKEYMTSINFIEIERIAENSIEDNVMYMNTLFTNI